MVSVMEHCEFKNRRIAVLGMARTGMAAAPILKDLGARVALSDSRAEEGLGEAVRTAHALGIPVYAGAASEEVLEGADLVVTSPGIHPDSPILAEARRRRIPVLAEIEVAYRISKAPILAVTGTNGKTTTTMLLGAMLRSAGLRCWVAGNIAADAVKQTLIDAAYAAEASDVIVAEVSSFQLMFVERFRPQIGILTNVTPDHLNWHHSFREYVEAKSRLFAAQTREDVAVLSALNAPARSIGERILAQRLWFDRGHCLKDDCACVDQGRFVVRWRGTEHILCRVDDLRLPGLHNVENALAAAAAAVAYGADDEAISTAIRTFSPVVHRMEPVAEIEGVLYINNSMCTNVDAAVRSLEAMDRPTVVICGGVDKNSDFTPLGTAIALRAAGMVTMGAAAGLLEEAARGAGFHRIERAVDMDDAVRKAAAMAPRGGAVMLSPACASFDMYPDFEARGAAFRDAVRRLQEG
ncbi:MAG: UDP-N-acetylmuramoyl-L-alanine--D-glutamate ligase [Chthonomonadales bacterium]